MEIRRLLQLAHEEAVVEGSLKKVMLVKALVARSCEGCRIDARRVPGVWWVGRGVRGSLYYLCHRTTTPPLTTHPPSLTEQQVGNPNMSTVRGLFLNLDFDEVKERYHGVVSGTGCRNQLYYYGMKAAGVTGHGNNIQAPGYYRAATAAAFPYGKGGVVNELPKSHLTAYEQEASPSQEEVESLIKEILAL